MRNKILCVSTCMLFLQLRLCNFCIKYVESFKYLGNRNDNDDIQREVRNLFMRTYMLFRRFINCSHIVKIILFRSYCVCLYDSCLWSNYTDGCLSKLKLCYHKCIKMFFLVLGEVTDSVTQILLQLGLPSFNTLIHNSRIIFLRTWTNCPNMLVSHFSARFMFLMYSFLAFYVYCLCVLCVCFMGLVPESNK